jgi:hypothetical protein
MAYAFLGYGGEVVTLNHVDLYFKPIICSDGGRPLRLDATELGAGRRLIITFRFSRFGVGRQSV